MNKHAAQAIDALGGTAEVARLFEISMPSVSDWKKEGIPPARVMFLRVAKRKQLAGIDLKAATAAKDAPKVEADG
jgi:hypothetical protein